MNLESFAVLVAIAVICLITGAVLRDQLVRMLVISLGPVFRVFEWWDQGGKLHLALLWYGLWNPSAGVPKRKLWPWIVIVAAVVVVGTAVLIAWMY